jgi:cytochrome c oxidase subunit IV
MGIYICIFLSLVKNMEQNNKKATTHSIGIYLWIWGLLFVFSTFSYLVDWYNFQGFLRWSLIIFFMLVKAGLIMAIFMHLYWERWAIVNVLLWPMTAIMVFVAIMTAESQYTLFTRALFFVTGS